MNRPPLHWAAPFVMVDRMITCEPNKQIVTIKHISAGDPVLGAESRDDPTFPSFLLLEGLSQSAALLYRLSFEEQAVETLPLLGYLKATLSERGAYPGDTLTFTVNAIKMTSVGGVFEGRADLDGVMIAEAELAFLSSTDSL
jgi:3-hydroxyacyl-[acyl-carrier-protein] dehydratase